MNYQTQLQAWQAREGAQASQKAPKSRRLAVWVILSVIAVPALWVAFGGLTGLYALLVALLGGIWINPNKGTGGLVRPVVEEGYWQKVDDDPLDPMSFGYLGPGPTGIEEVDRSHGWPY